MWQCGTVEDVGRESGELQCGTVEDVGRESGELRVAMWDSGRCRARVWRAACGNVGQWKM